MNKLILILLFFVYIQGSELIFTQEEKDFLKNHPIIKVSNEKNWVPFDFMIGTQATGYSIDILKLIEKKIGIKFEYVNNHSWNELWDMFKNKQIDIVHPVILKEDRKLYGNYTNSFFSGKYVFITKKHSPTINNIEHLYGKTISAPKDWPRTIFLQNNFPQIKLLLTNNVEESYLAVETGKAYATVELDAVIRYKLRKSMNDNLKINSAFKAFNQLDHKLHYLIRKDWPLLFSIFQKAYDSIGLDEIDNIQKKWFPISSKKSEIFTKNEKKWLNNNSFIKLAYIKSWDDEYSQKIHKEKKYVNLLNKYSNIAVQLVFFDTWEEALKELENGKSIQGITFLSGNDKQKYFNCLPPYFFTPYYILMNKDNNNSFTMLKDLKNKSVYIKKGSYLNEFIKNLPYKVNIIPVDSEKQMLENISNLDSQIKIAITESVNKQFLEENNIKIVKKIYNEYSNIYTGVNKKYKEVFSILKKAHERIPKNEFVKMRNAVIDKQEIIFTNAQKEYLDTKEDISMCVNSNWIPFSYYEGKKLKGISKSYLDLISKAVDKKLNVNVFQTQKQLKNMVKLGKCDIVSFVKDSDNYLTQKLFLSKPLIDLSYVAVSSKDKFFVDEFEFIKDQEFAVLRNSEVYHYLKNLYPNINLIEVDTLDEGFQEILKDDVYAFIGSSASVSYAIENKKYHNFKIIHNLELQTQLFVGVDKKDRNLKDIIIKIINSISDEDIRNIYNEQVFLQKERIIDYSILWKVVLGGLLIVGLIIYRHKEVARHNKELKRANKLLRNAQKEIEEKNEELVFLAATDNLTGISNRMCIDKFLNNEINRSSRYGSAFSFCIIDIDYFKKINDNYGHQVGDEVLIEIASILKNFVRKIDFVGRWGGEEFTILCPETKIQEAQKFCEILRRKIENHDFSKIGKQTVSIGISEYTKGDNMETVLKRADDALYEAKKTGRNKVVIM